MWCSLLMVYLCEAHTCQWEKHIFCWYYDWRQCSAKFLVLFRSSVSLSLSLQVFYQILDMIWKYPIISVNLSSQLYSFYLFYVSWSSLVRLSLFPDVWIPFSWYNATHYPFYKSYSSDINTNLRSLFVRIFVLCVLFFYFFFFLYLRWTT